MTVVRVEWREEADRRLDAALGAGYGVEGFEPFRGRDLSDVLRVAVYRNLQKTTRVCYSLRNRPDGLVVGHATKVAIAGAWVHTNPKEQAKIAAGGKRTVHAWVYGSLTHCPPDDSPWWEGARRVIYRPHESPLFRFEDTGTRVDWAPIAVFDEDGMWVGRPWEASA